MKQYSVLCQTGWLGGKWCGHDTQNLWVQDQGGTWTTDGVQVQEEEDWLEGVKKMKKVVGGEKSEFVLKFRFFPQ